MHDNTKTGTDGHLDELQNDGNEAWETIYALEERMTLLTKFTVKETYAKTTTLCLLKDDEGDLSKEDSKIIFDFLVEDWVNILLGSKVSKKS